MTVSKAMRRGKRAVLRKRACQWAAWGALIGAIGCLSAQVLSLFMPLMDRAYAGFLVPGASLLGLVSGRFLPMKNEKTARLLDRAGLLERVETSLQYAGDTPMQALLRADAAQKLAEMDVGRIPPLPWKKPAGMALLLTLLSLVLFLLPSPQQGQLDTIRHFQTARDTAVEALRKAEEEADKGHETADSAETRKILRDAQREVGRAQDVTEAMLSLSRAQERLEKQREADLASRMEALSSAAGEAGLSELAEALQAGDLSEAAESLSQAGAAGLSALAQAGGDMLSAATQMLSDALAEGELTQAQLTDAMQSAMASGTGLQGVSEARGALSGNGQGEAGGKGGEGAGSGSGNGDNQQAGGGAGKGSTNTEQQGSGSRGHGTGNDTPHYYVKDYEALYDPEREAMEMRSVGTDGQNGSGSDTVVWTGPMDASRDGMIDPSRYTREYQAAAAKAAEDRALTKEENEAVKAYFAQLVEGE